MLAGYAQIEVTPEPGEEMTGYGYFLNRRGQGKLDPLFARAVALDDGKNRAVLVQADLLGLSPEFVSEIRELVMDEHGLPPEGLMFHCSHTHSGPATMMLFGCGIGQDGYLELLRERFLEVIRQALADRCPVVEGRQFEIDWPEGFANNRVGLPDKDTFVRGLELTFEHRRPLLFISYACHPVTLGRNDFYSADYPGALVHEFNAYGNRAVFLNGPCGDIDPLSNTIAWGAGTTRTLELYARDLATVVRQGLRENANDWKFDEIKAISHQIPLDVEIPDVETLKTELDDLFTALETEPGNPIIKVDILWHEHMIKLHAENNTDRARNAEIHVIACGDVVFAGLSCEAFTRLGTIIRSGAPGKTVMVAACANGVVGYIATREDVEHNGYASYGAAKLYGFGLARPGAGEKWAEEGKKLVIETIG